MTYDPYTLPPKTHNQEPFALIKQEIEDLFDEAKNFADGEPIDRQEMHDAIEKLYDGLHEAGKRADAMRVEEKKPLDDAVQAVQDKYNPLIQPKKGKVALGKDALGTLLAAWRKKIADEKAETARLARVESDRIAAEAQAAIRASAGNLEARVEAEELLEQAKQVEKFAKRADKAATTGTGLRTVWRCTLEDEGKALDWAYGRAPERFREMVQSMAEETVRAGMRSVPGFRVWDDKVAA
ncbi:hypothetical protein LB523_12195 [Mesorhizobium sp. ESP-6-4]|uniref:hypothetical protein n=1 Tax=Mesorhizobium sp. ESP-6-4 TaxID=2876624 RepID=UPI001CC94E47|nr:hypothetical protein [Mesorhizobium sp. ESP-6-4]MBZ9659807.1 hypothetical protein [Mesorhizobium sp. ESP-6-4]